MRRSVYLKYGLLVFIGLFLVNHCGNNSAQKATDQTETLKPVIVTQPVRHDTDDPAIWIHPTDPGKSLIIGTDKDEDGALYVFDLQGRIDEQKTVRGLKRPNNVDVEYGLILKGTATDITITTERLNNKIRIFSLPDMQAIDNGGLEVFLGESLRAPMGIAIYKRPSDQVVFAIVGRKEGPTDGSYLWQYRLEDDGQGQVQATKVRSFGQWSGSKEIEAIAVDDALGYVYYSDEDTGIRKYHADPDVPDANKELALFGTEGYTDDREGISIYQLDDATGYILVSDQSVNKFHIYKREGEENNPHQHELVKVVNVSTLDSDGSEVTSSFLSQSFPGGLFVAMSADKTFHYYAWADIAGKDLETAGDE